MLEDLGLAAWNALAVPLLLAGGGGFVVQLGDRRDALAGVVQAAAVLAAIAAVATRPPRDLAAGQRDGVALQVAFIGPFIGAVAFVSGSASAYLGFPVDGMLILAAFVAIVAAMAFGDHLPTLDTGVRRALLTPFVFICAGIFNGLAADMLQGLDVGKLIGAAVVDETGFGIFVVGMLVAGIGAFYAALVAAPRALILRESVIGCVAWPLRFVFFLLSALVGVGWLSAIGV